MKKLIKFIIPILFFLSGFSTYSQVKFIGTSNRFIVTGRGDVKGIALDNARIVNWSIVNSPSFETTVYLESLTTGKAGIIIRDANATNNLNGGRPCYYLYLLKATNKIRLDYRASVGSGIINLLEINNPSSSGLWLNLKKVDNTLISRISTSPKSEVGTQVWTEINTTPSNALANYTSFSRGIIVASGSPSNVDAVFSNWKVISSTPITIPAPTISSSVNPFVVGTSTFLSATNCNYTVDWYKNAVFQSSGNILNISSPVLNDIYNAKCKNGSNVSFASNELVVSNVSNQGSFLVNTLIDRVIPVTTKWNYFDSDLIPDFQQQKYLDSKSGEMLPNKWAIWHAPNRNLFGNTQAEQLTKMFKKGWTAINASKIGGAFSGMENIITFDRIVVDGGFANTNGDAIQDATYDNFEAYAKTPFGYASIYNIPKDNSGRWRAFLSDIDYESKYTSMDSQLSANYHVIAYNSGLAETTGRYGFQYGGGNNASYYTNEIYNGGNSTIWSLPAVNTGNSADGVLKPQYVGKALKDNPRFVGRSEVSYYFEEFLPQGYQVKDQDGNNWFRLNHFGDVCATGCGQNTPTNSDNWASHLGTLIEVNYKIHHSLNQDFIIQIKPVNERDNGFKYSEQNRAYYGNKRIFEYNRYGTVQPNPSACSTCTFVASMGSEYIPSFIAEAQIFLSYASGAKGISFWSSAFTDISYPHDKSQVARSGARYDDASVLNADLDPYIYTMKALWRMNQKIDVGNGTSYSFNDIADGTEIYLNEKTKVVYPNSDVVTQLRALDWQILQKTPVRAVVNVAKNVVFVIAFQAYASEQDRITFKLTDYGANISQIIDVPAGKVVVKAFPLTGVISDNTTIPTPTIVSSNNNPNVGQTVNLTSSGCGSNAINKWYDNQEGNYLSSGLVYSTVVVNGNGYYAKCVSTTNNSVSLNSNIITFSISDNVNVFVLVGESNNGTRNQASTLLSGESGLRNGVRIWNNNTNILEQLNIGTNNYLDENESIANGWGIENELANLRATGTLNSDFVIIKTAQGGARIGNYNSDIEPHPNYFDKVISRINGVKTALQAENKVPVFYVLYSQGINNATTDGKTLTDNGHFPNLSGTDYYKAATKLLSDKIRLVTGSNTKFSYMKFFSPYGDYLNQTIQEIVNENVNNTSITTSDLEIQPDGLHFSASGTKKVADRYITSLDIVKFNSPTITSNVQNSYGGQTIILTSSGCSNGLTNQFFANNTLIGTGNSISVVTTSGVTYSAKCVLMCESPSSSVTVTVSN